MKRSCCDFVSAKAERWKIWDIEILLKSDGIGKRKRKSDEMIEIQ